MFQPFAASALQKNSSRESSVARFWVCATEYKATQQTPPFATKERMRAARQRSCFDVRSIDGDGLLPICFRYHRAQMDATT
jgi:hypothetical protein